MGMSSARQLDKIRDKTVEELKEYCLKDNNNTPTNLPNGDEDDKMRCFGRSLTIKRMHFFSK